ncbi:MAG: sigma 54-interacting transcriptional regulator [Desulfobacterales bacterium]
MEPAAKLRGWTIGCSSWLDILDDLGIGAFLVDRRRRIEAINTTARAIIEVSVEEVLGRDCREVFLGVPCLAACPFAAAEDATGGKGERGIRNGEGASGFLVTRVAVPVFDARRRPAGCLTVLQDLRPIAGLVQRIHHEERSLRHILDSLEVGILTVDRGGIVTFFNTAAEKIAEIGRGEVLGRPCGELFRGEASHNGELLRETISRGEPHEGVESCLITPGGIRVPIRIRHLPLRDEKGTVVGGLATFSDLTLVRRLDEALQDRTRFHDLVGKSPVMQRIFENVRIVSPTDATVLIEGPTGTGKDVLARVIHEMSPRRARPFVKVNCAAIPETLLESEMFGYVKGAFTGAVEDRVGRFQAAEGGTIFLDEIGDLPLGLQVKLLRVIEEKAFFRLGSPRTTRVDVRILAASNQSLARLVARRKFREDLYYRLNVFRIELPPLRERQEDLPLLIRHILRRLCASRGIPVPEVSENALHLLLNYRYPGNIRELENILEHALILCPEGVLRRRHLPEYLLERKAPPLEEGPAVQHGRNAERGRILAALRRSGGNKAQAARLLGMDRSTLWRKLRRLGIAA